MKLEDLSLSELLELRDRIASEIAERDDHSRRSLVLYGHPTDPALFWDGMGRMPSWFSKLMDAGFDPKTLIKRNGP